MKLTNKSLKLAGVLSLALIGASPMVLSTAATAAPMQPAQMQQHQDMRFAQNDRNGYANDQRGHNDRDAHGSYGQNDRDHNRYGYDDRRYGDRFHKPPQRFERIYRPHFARFFHQGHWDFKFGHWMWVGGFWTR
jgi:hypothetical protein